MAHKYSLNGKIARILKDEHGIDAEVSGLVENGEAGIRVSAGNFTEQLSGLVSKDRLADLAARIKGTLN
jgi:hypothetical protein